MSRPVSPGEVIGEKYAIVRRVGRGGMGVVFEARHVVIGRKVAIKFLRSDVARDEKRLVRIEREARACGSLHHENIAAVHDFAKDELGRPYIVMEFVEGTSLRELVEVAAPLEPERAIELVCQAARGLGAAHQAGVLHRDLKPENLMLTRRADGGDWVKLLDFGVARLAEDAAKLTLDGQVPGTPDYLAPEIARHETTSSVQSDLYALGVVLFELLTGRRPHASGSRAAVLHHIAEHPAARIEELRPELSAPLVRAVNRVLSRDPAERPRTALELLEELQAARGRSLDESQETVTSLDAFDARNEPARRSASNQADGHLATITPVGRTLPREKPIRNRGVALGALFLVLGVAALFYALGSRAVGSEPIPGEPRVNPTPVVPAAPPAALATPDDVASARPPQPAASPGDASVETPAAPSSKAAPKPAQRKPSARPTRPAESAPEPGISRPSAAPEFDRKNPFRE